MFELARVGFSNEARKLKREEKSQKDED